MKTTITRTGQKTDKDFLWTQFYLDNAPDAIFWTDPTGQICYVNNSACKLLDKTYDELLEKNFFDIDVNLSHESWLEFWKEMEKDRFKSFESFFFCKDGNTKAVEILAKYLEYEGWPLIYMSTKDISEKKQTEEALRESEQKFRALIDQAADGIIFHDFSGNIIDINRQTEISFGYTREEVIGRIKVQDMDPNVENKQHPNDLWQQLKTGEPYSFETIHVRKDQSTYPVEVRLGIVEVNGEKHILSIWRNITKRKQAEDELKNAFEQIQNLKEHLEQENVYLKKEIQLKHGHKEIIGESPAVTHVLENAEKVAPLNTCVLLLGETGTGKELLAHEIHRLSARSKKTMITVNCAALPATLIETELFGCEKGAYTGAFQSRMGRFEAAKGGTVFLDEIGDLPIEIQAKLLKVLQSGQFERVGSTNTVTVDVRVIAATNHDLEKCVSEGKFRKDLFYRLNVFPIHLPPLRERKEDIPLLVWSFVKSLGENMGKMIDAIPKKTMKKLCEYHWPGNIREIKNIIERAMILSSGSVLQIDRLENDSSEIKPYMMLDEVVKEHIINVLEISEWRIRGKRGAAEKLNIKPTTLESKMKKLGITRKIKYST